MKNNFRKEAKKDLDDLIEKYGTVIFAVQNPEKESETMVSMTGCAGDIVFMIEGLVGEFLKFGDEDGAYEVARDLVRMAIAKAEINAERERANKKNKDDYELAFGKLLKALCQLDRDSYGDDDDD